MERVTGVGGIFFKAADTKRLQAWYEEHLGIAPGADGCVSFRWEEPNRHGDGGVTVWSPFSAETRYFEPSRSSFMINYRVKNLEAMLDQLRRGGVELVGEPETSEYGRFAWIVDPEGNKIELWEPPVRA